MNESPIIARTVGELAAILAAFPPDMPLVHGDTEEPSPSASFVRYTPTQWEIDNYDLPASECVVIH